MRMNPTLFAVLFVLLAGCADRAKSVEVSGVYTTRHCTGKDKNTVQRHMTDAEVWSHYFTTVMAGGMLPTPPLPDVDFSTGAILVVDMGQKPTGGYGIVPGDREATIERGTLIVHVRLQTPDPGAFQTQVLTHPCLALGIPSEGYGRIEVYDEATQMLLGVLDLAK